MSRQALFSIPIAAFLGDEEFVSSAAMSLSSVVAFSHVIIFSVGNPRIFLNEILYIFFHMWPRIFIFLFHF